MVSEFTIQDCRIGLTYLNPKYAIDLLFRDGSPWRTKSVS